MYQERMGVDWSVRGLVFCGFDVDVFLGGWVAEEKAR